MIPPHPPIQVVAPAPQPVAAPMGSDDKGRPTITVSIDGGQPFEAVVDTGAQRTILSLDLVRSLGLTPKDTQTQVSGIAGGEAASSYAIGQFSSGLFDLRNVEFLALSSIGVTQAKAIVGMDLFRTRKLTFDPQRRQIRVELSGPAMAGSMVIRGTTAPDGLIIPLMVNGIPMQALVDTGAEGCIAGPDVLKALGWDPDDYRLAPYGQISGASAGNSRAQLGTMDRVTIGPMAFRNVPIVFLAQPASGDGDPGKPTLIVGLDVLKKLGIYSLDFPRGELQIAIPSAR